MDMAPPTTAEINPFNVKLNKFPRIIATTPNP